MREVVRGGPKDSVTTSVGDKTDSASSGSRRCITKRTTLGASGTPQGAVISPLLFNIAMRGLSDRPATVTGTGHALYVDDITVWCVGGSDAAVESVLQEALDIIEHFPVDTGLESRAAEEVTSAIKLQQESRQHYDRSAPDQLQEKVTQLSRLQEKIRELGGSTSASSTPSFQPDPGPSNAILGQLTKAFSAMARMMERMNPPSAATTIHRLTKTLQPTATNAPLASFSTATGATVPTLSMLNATSDASNSKSAALPQPAAFLHFAHATVHIPATFNAVSDAESSHSTATSQPAFVASMSPMTKLHTVRDAKSLGSLTMSQPAAFTVAATEAAASVPTTLAPVVKSCNQTSESQLTTLTAAASTGSTISAMLDSANSMPADDIPNVSSCVPVAPTSLITVYPADDSLAEMAFTMSPDNDHNTPSLQSGWSIVSTRCKLASAARPRTELISVGIQLPPGTLTPKLPLYYLLAAIISAAHLSSKNSGEITLQAKPAQSLVPSPPGSYAATVKGPSVQASFSSTTIPSPSLIDENHFFDLRLTMLERHQREHQRISQDLQQQIHVLTQALKTTTSSLTSQLTKLNEQLATFITPSPNPYKVTPLADLVEATPTAHHTRLLQLETSIVQILTTLQTQSKQLESFASMLGSLQESLYPAKKKEHVPGNSSTSNLL
ncbi:uncharacterized protein [Dermacentor albipictus]|uniref:uncharacterized protein n=1 Tax=Dermacentor albipictus TaxID=60249 RepID=UPI0031FBBFDE